MNNGISDFLKSLSIAFLSSILVILWIFIILHFTISQSFENELGYALLSHNKAMINDEHVINVTTLCQNDDNRAIVRCVNNYFIERYNYTSRSDGKVKTPSDMFTTGGLCRDSALFYCTTLHQLDIPCDIKYVENHVFNVADLGNGEYCIIDQEFYLCL